MRIDFETCERPALWPLLFILIPLFSSARALSASSCEPNEKVGRSPSPWTTVAHREVPLHTAHELRIHRGSPALWSCLSQHQVLVLFLMGGSGTNPQQDLPNIIYINTVQNPPPSEVRDLMSTHPKTSPIWLSFSKCPW